MLGCAWPDAGEPNEAAPTISETPKPLFPVWSIMPSLKHSEREFRGWSAGCSKTCTAERRWYSDFTVVTGVCGGRGTRQGDSTGSDIFCATYNEAVIAAKAARPARPHQVLQYNGRSVDPTLLTFVDDIAQH